MIFAETELHFALGEGFAIGEPEKAPAAPATEDRVHTIAAPSTSHERAAESTEHGLDCVRSERRRHARQPRLCRISYFAAGDDQQPRGVRVVDLSPGGIGVMADRTFRVGTALTFCFSGEGESTCLLATVRVVRVDAFSEGKWFLGCQFATELAADEFAEVLARTSRAGCCQ